MLTARQAAGVAPRALACLLDAVLLLALSTPLMWLAYREPVARVDDTRPASLAINWLLPAAYFAGMWCWQGATFGKLLAGVRVIDARTGRRPGLAQSLLRWLGYFVSVLPLGLGLIGIAVDRNRQAWHDKLAGTLVVPRRTRPASTPPGGLAGYLGAHWRGEQSLLQSYWLNNVLLSFPLGLTLTGLMSWISMKGEALQAGSIATLVGWPLLIVVSTWCTVGAWRAASAYRRMDGSALWANLARLSLLLGALQLVASFTIGFAPQIGTYWQMARGIDPLGHASLQLSADGRVLQMRGPIGMGDATRLRKLLDANPQPVQLFDLESPGGRVVEAERIALQVRRGGSRTRAVGGCESACTLVFLAGSERQLMPGAQLGFHRASSGTYNPVFDELANQHLSRIYRRMGLPESFIERTLRTPPHRMWYPASAELVAHALIDPLPQTLDIVLPADPASESATYVDALRANPAWHALESRYPGSIADAAARMLEVRAAGAADEATQMAGQQIVAQRMGDLLMGAPAELRRRYLHVLKAQLNAALGAEPGLCPALLSGQAGPRRRLPQPLLAREAAWLIEAAGATPPRRRPGAPSALELEVVRRSLGAHAPGLLSGLWPGGASRANASGSRCDQVLQTLDRAASLPAAQRELAERLVFQAPGGA